MKKLKKKSELMKRWMVVLLGSTLLLVSLIQFILSFQQYNDGYGTDISFDMDYLVLMLCGISILSYGIYSIVSYYKNLNLKLAYYSAFGVISVFLSFYPLGVFFKAVSKHKPFMEYQEYLYVGILGVILLIYLIFCYLSDNNKEE